MINNLTNQIQFCIWMGWDTTLTYSHVISKNRTSTCLSASLPNMEYLKEIFQIYNFDYSKKEQKQILHITIFYDTITLLEEQEELITLLEHLSSLITLLEHLISLTTLLEHLSSLITLLEDLSSLITLLEDLRLLITLLEDMSSRRNRLPSWRT